MRTFVIAMVAMLAWDVVAKLLRLWQGKTYYPPAAAVVDGVFCLAFLVWGMWVLAAG